MRIKMLVAALGCAALITASPAAASTTSGPVQGLDVAMTQNVSKTVTVANLVQAVGATWAVPTAIEINWADGSPATTGTLGAGTMSRPITGTHTYAAPGTYNAAVTVTYKSCAVVGTIVTPLCGPKTTTVTALSTIVVGDPAVTSSGGISGAHIEADSTLPFSGVVGTSSKALAGATIAWGDGTTTDATIDGSNITGTHTWASAGSYDVVVTVTTASVDVIPGGCYLAKAAGVQEPFVESYCLPGTTYVVHSHAVVHVFGLEVDATGVTSTEGVPVSGRVAGLPAACEHCTYSASINWGDGATTSGSVVPSGSGMAVVGTHDYGRQPGTYRTTVTVTATSLAGRSQTVKDSGTATIADAALVASSGGSFDVYLGDDEPVAVGHFSDTGPSPIASDYTVGISWGDGSTSVGTVTADPLGGFTVSGSHNYATAGNYAVRFHVHSAHGAEADGSATAVATVLVLN